MGLSAEIMNLDTPGAIKAIREGLDFKVFEETAQELGVTKQDLAAVVGIPLRTLHRRRGETLKQHESERLMRVVRCFYQAVEMFSGDTAKARKWFTNPKVALRNQTPLASCETDLGTQEVLDLIYRIEHGVYV